MKVEDPPIHVYSVLPGMLKSSIFEAHAGRDEPESASALRKTISTVMNDDGMDVDEGCKLMMSKIDEGSV